MRSLTVSFVTLFAAGLLGVVPATAAQIVVDSTDDTTAITGDCILRHAITAANTDAAVGGCPAGMNADTIVFSINSTSTTIALIDQLPHISSDLTIRGPGADQLTIDAGGISRILPIVYDGTVRISGLTFTNGNSDSNVYTFPVLQVRGYGGAVFINTVGKVYFTEVIFRNNFARQAGGAIHHQLGELNVDNSIFEGNSMSCALPFGGGAISVIGEEPVLNITNSTFHNNRAGTQEVNLILGNHGGALFVRPSYEPAVPIVTIDNSTFSGNEASGHGGAIAFFHELNAIGAAQYKVKASISNTTIVNNTADIDLVYWGFGGGLYAALPIEPYLENSIIAENAQATTAGPFNFPDLYYQVDSSGYNFIGQAQSGQGFGSNDQVGSSTAPLKPGLSSLGNHGGFTPTHLPEKGSPVIDKGRSAARQDQRGEQREQDMIPAIAPGGDDSDTGAVELQRRDL